MKAKTKVECIENVKSEKLPSCKAESWRADHLSTDFTVVSGKIHIASPYHDYKTLKDSNIWDLKARNGIWRVLMSSVVECEVGNLYGFQKHWTLIAHHDPDYLEKPLMQNMRSKDGMRKTCQMEFRFEGYLGGIFDSSIYPKDRRTHDNSNFTMQCSEALYPNMLTSIAKGVVFYYRDECDSAAVEVELDKANRAQLIRMNFVQYKSDDR